MIQSRTAYFLISVLLTGSLGYYVGQAPVSQLQTEMNTIEQSNIILLDQLSALEEENRNFKNQIKDILENITLQNIEMSARIEQLENVSDETNTLYLETLDDYQELLQTYHVLLLAFQGMPTPPQGEMSITLIPGIVNGDWSDGNEGWLTQGVSNLVGGVKFLHENDRGTYSTQTVYLDEYEQGIQLDIKPQPFGGELVFQVRLMGITVYEQTYSGPNSNYDWETIIIPFNWLMIMREQYGFAVDGSYNVSLMVKSGENTGSNIALDNVSLIEIEYD